jgi:hypothetical protein
MPMSKTVLEAVAPKLQEMVKGALDNARAEVARLSELDKLLQDKSQAEISRTLQLLHEFFEHLK